MAPNSGISITGVFLRFYESLVERTEIGYISADDRQWRAFLLQQTLRFGPAGSRTLSGYLLEQQEYGVLLSLVRPAAWHCRSLPREDAMAALRLAVRAAFAVEGEESEEGDALAEMMMMMAMDDCLLDLIGIAYEFHCPRRIFFPPSPSRTRAEMVRTLPRPKRRLQRGIAGSIHRADFFSLPFSSSACFSIPANSPAQLPFFSPWKRPRPFPSFRCSSTPAATSTRFPRLSTSTSTFAAFPAISPSR